MGNLENRLALHGGPKSLEIQPSSFTWFDSKDIEAVKNLLTTQKLSGFLAQPGSAYLGGPNVVELEREFIQKYQMLYAISFNSWTSGLEAIFLSLDLPIGSEVIVPAWTMSATVAGIALANLNPVFCDIEKESFNLDPRKVENLVTSRTRAICVVDIFGQPANWPEFRRIADAHNLILISDSAQTPLAKIQGKSPVNFADVGGFSFNRHKHLQTGEGGIVLTNNSELCARLQAIRNHGEVSAPEVQLMHTKLIGHNWRLGEIEALLAKRQLQKSSLMIEARRKAAGMLSEGLSQLGGLRIPKVLLGAEHDYYILGMHFDATSAGFTRDFAVQALRAEGIDFVIGTYCELQKVEAYREFKNGELSVTEELNRHDFLGLYLCGYHFDEALIDSTLRAFRKVWNFKVI